MSIPIPASMSSSLAEALRLVREAGYYVTPAHTGEDVHASWNQLYGREEGTGFELLAPDSDAIELDTLAHGLANECRFGGHTRVFLPVAIHCYRGSFHFSDPNEGLDFLFHDAAEGLGLRDLSRKIVRLPEMAFYRELVDNLMGCVATRFRLRDDFWKRPRIIEVDDRMLFAEQREYLAPPPEGRRWGFWENRVPSFQRSTSRLTPCPPPLAKRLWLLRVSELAVSAGHPFLADMANEVLAQDLRDELSLNEHAQSDAAGAR